MGAARRHFRLQDATQDNHWLQPSIISSWKTGSNSSTKTSASKVPENGYSSAKIDTRAPRQCHLDAELTGNPQPLEKT
jgi:hypothetical protein